MKKSYIISAVCAALFLLMIILIKTVDVADIGPEGTKIGLSSINKAFHELTGLNDSWDKIADYTMLLAFGAGLAFAVLGLVQLIQRKSLLKVDREILLLGGLYVVLGIFYVIFEKVVINYRPEILSDETKPEASFPSSHVMMACVVAGSVIIILGRYIKKAEQRVAARIILSVVMLISVAARLVSGVHWLTDIIAGVLLSCALVFLYKGLIENGTEE